VHGLGQIQPHLEFGIVADPQTAITLEDQAFPRNTTVFELDPRPVHRQSAEIASGEPLECAGRTEPQLSGRHGGFGSRRHRRHHGAAERFVRECIAHHADIRLLPYLGNRRGRQVPEPILLALFHASASGRK